MLLLLILPVWALGLIVVAGLCYSARIGDARSEYAAKDRGALAALVPVAPACGTAVASPRQIDIAA